MLERVTDWRFDMGQVILVVGIVIAVGAIGFMAIRIMNAIVDPKGK